MSRSKRVSETQRLSLEGVTLQDSAFMLKLLNSPNWLKYIGDRGVHTEEDAREYIQQSIINSYLDKGYGLYKMVLKEKKTPVGLCGFLKRDYLADADLGFAILPEYERKGLTFEAAEEVVKYGRSVLKLDPILAITTPANMKSRNLLKKLGFHHTGEVTSDGNEKLMLFSTTPNTATTAEPG